MKKLYGKTLKNIYKVFKRTEGFTLIEIMIVVAIIGILSAIVGPQLFRQIDRADVAAAKNQISNFEVALQSYNLENKNYPDAGEGLQALLRDGHIKKIPKDPWKNDYVYTSPGSCGDYEIVSYGKDGKPGGDGFNADISSCD